MKESEKWVGVRTTIRGAKSKGPKIKGIILGVVVMVKIRILKLI